MDIGLQGSAFYTKSIKKAALAAFFTLPTN
jgi:hypothetical protein